MHEKSAKKKITLRKEKRREQREKRKEAFDVVQTNVFWHASVCVPELDDLIN